MWLSLLLAGSLGLVPTAWLVEVRSALAWPLGGGAAVAAEGERVAKLAAENAALRQELARARAWAQVRAAGGPAALEARVLAAGLGTAGERSLWLDRGRDDGVRSGLAVVLGTALAGRVLDVGRTRCAVRLAIDPAMRLRVFLGTSGHTGLARGADGLEVIYVEREARPAEGEPWFTTGEDQGVPRGLVAGWTLAVEDAEDGFLRVRLAAACPWPILGPLGIVREVPLRGEAAGGCQPRLVPPLGGIEASCGGFDRGPCGASDRGTPGAADRPAPEPSR